MNRESDHCECFDAPLELRVVLGHIRGELVELGRCADGLQATISAIVSDFCTALGASAQVELQAADMLSQRLGRLAQFSDILEARVPADWTLNQTCDDAVIRALSSIGKADTRSAAPTMEEVGDCELF